MIATYAFTITQTPASANAGGGGTRANKYAAHREKKSWEGIYLKELMALRARRRMLHCSVTVQLHFKNKVGGNGRDEENYRQPTIKPLADALQIGGYLPNDTREFFEVNGLELVEGERPWPMNTPRLPKAPTSYMIVTLEATYADD